jgi:hypothetical protein
VTLFPLFTNLRKESGSGKFHANKAEPSAHVSFALIEPRGLKLLMLAMVVVLLLLSHSSRKGRQRCAP